MIIGVPKEIKAQENRVGAVPAMVLDLVGAGHTVLIEQGAGLGAGVWKNKDEIRRTWREERRFKPTADRTAVNEHLRRWDVAVAKA